jgi:predicted nucleic acid-binding protein
VTAWVLDASVAVKWFLPAAAEPLVPEARRVLEGYCAATTALLAPDLFWPELGNVFWKCVRLGRLSRRSAAEPLGAVRSLKIPTAPTEPLIEPALAIAERFRRTVYDAVYVALAVDRGVPLLTADERLANALAARLPVRWLGAA